MTRLGIIVAEESRIEQNRAEEERLHQSDGHFQDVVSKTEVGEVVPGTARHKAKVVQVDITITVYIKVVGKARHDCRCRNVYRMGMMVL